MRMSWYILGVYLLTGCTVRHVAQYRRDNTTINGRCISLYRYDIYVRPERYRLANYTVSQKHRTPTTFWQGFTKKSTDVGNF